MKGLLKIYGKYIGIVWLGFLLLLIGNFVVGIWIIVDGMVLNNGGILGGIGNLEAQIFEEDGSFTLTEDAEGYFAEKQIVFLFVLDEQGKVVYEWNLPEDFEDHYSLGEVAAFSRWYLHDYPVKVWQGERGLLVAGGEKNSLWKYNMEFTMDFMRHVGFYIKIFCLVNLVIILLLIVLLGYRYYCSLKPLSEGMEGLAAGRRICIPEKGVTAQLSAALNKTSDILEKQRETLSRRDTARTEWVAGVSHDIRTPLSVIVGYAQELEENTQLCEADRKKAEIIKNQSLRISKLIEDLNLTSKLAYHMQPLRVESFYPASLLRLLAAELLNEGLEERYKLELLIAPELENQSFKGDKELIGRSLRNLLGNSIRHNPAGCSVFLEGHREGESLALEVWDDGRGIPEEVVKILNGEKCAGTEHKDAAGENKPHIMGLNIVKQIALAHGGTFAVTRETHGVKLLLPWAHDGSDGAAGSRL